MADQAVPEIEEWRIVADFPDYEVSNLGRVRRATDAIYAWGGYRWTKNYELAQRPNKDGYLQVRMIRRKSGGKRVWMSIARMVCAAFHGPCPPDKTEVAHGDADRTNNRPYNLRWATNLENQQDAARHGSRKGGRNGRAMLTEDEVRDIRRRLASGEVAWRIAEELGRGRTTIEHIKSRKNWGWLTD